MLFRNSLLSLLRHALGASAETIDLSALTKQDWQKVMDLAFDQGVAALAVDGLQKSLEHSAESLELSLDSPELEDLKYEWFGEALSCEDDYRKQKNTIASSQGYMHKRISAR